MDTAIPSGSAPTTGTWTCTFSSGQVRARSRLDLFYDYRTNVDLYPRWQAFLRERSPKTLILWGENDIFFTPEGGRAYLRDLPDAELRLRQWTLRRRGLPRGDRQAHQAIPLGPGRRPRRHGVGGSTR